MSAGWWVAGGSALAFVGLVAALRRLARPLPALPPQPAYGGWLPPGREPAPDERVAVLSPGEAWLPREAVDRLGTERVAEMNASSQTIIHVIEADGSTTELGFGAAPE